MTFKEYFKNEDYIVKDLIREDAKDLKGDDVENNEEELIGDDEGIEVPLEYLFVLESPHNDEITEGYPVAGASGEDMVKCLFENKQEEWTLGKLVYDGVNEWSKKIGIMNVSRVPLQKTKLIEDETEFVEMFELLSNYRNSKTPMGNFQKKEYKEYREVINESFKKRLKGIKNRVGINIVICGNFAKRHYDYIKKTNEDIKFKEEFFVPHPSRHQWLKLGNLQKLKDAINQSVINTEIVVNETGGLEERVE
ncbi:MAG: hypothetical protein ACOH15_11480 [Acetobacterium sp.]